MKVPKYRFKIIEKKVTVCPPGLHSYTAHYCKVYINDPPRKSRKHNFSFTFTGEHTHKALLDLQEIANGKMPLSLALLHINSDNPHIKSLVQKFIHQGV